MIRAEFPAKIKDQAAARAHGACQRCGMPFSGKKMMFDHILPDSLGGRPILANCQVLCEPCHTIKTGKEDVPRVRKADRQRRADIGAIDLPHTKIHSRGFPQKQKREQKPSLPPLRLYEDCRK